MISYDARDLRDFFEFGNFKVNHLITDLSYISYFGSIKQIIIRNVGYKNKDGKRDVRGQAAE